MKRVVIALGVVLFTASVGFSDLTWSCGDLVAGGISGIGSGSAAWYVQMYRDVNNDTSLSAVTFMDDTGVATGVGNSSDDILLGSYTDSLTYDSRSGSVYFSEIYSSYTDIYSENVYTVILDATDWATATQSFVLDQTTQLIAGSGVEDYTLPNNNPGGNSWQNLVAVPEPSTIAFVLLGVGAFSLRRRAKKA